MTRIDHFHRTSPDPEAQPTAMTTGADLASGPDETVEYIMQNIESADDDLLAVFGALAAHGRIRIIPHADYFFQERQIPILSLPQKMHDRLIRLGREHRK